MINIDFLVAGCNTRRKHCYVNGSPGPIMPIEDVILCIKRLEEIAKYLPVGTSFTLDHETINHPNNSYKDFGITIHGVAEHHDEIVGRKGGFDIAVSAAKFLVQMGCQVQISLMMNRYFADDADKISRLLDEVGANDIWFAIPIFTPHSNMMAFEPYRATLEAVHAIRHHLPHWRQNEQDLIETARQNSIKYMAIKILLLNKP